jgi:ParB family chromosome partitioning protein
LPGDAARDGAGHPAQESGAGGLTMLPVESISPNPHQPRQSFGHEELEELAGSIQAHGVLQPVVVARAERAGAYHLIAGERRWRASMLAGLKAVPAIVKDVSPREMLELALVENVQRSDLNPLEEAAAYRALVDEFGLKQDEIGERVGKSRAAVNNSLRLLTLPPRVQEAVANRQIDAGHARAILQVPGEERQIQLMEYVIARQMTVRQVEELARRLAESAAAAEEDDVEDEPEKADLYDPIRELEDRFRGALGTKVQLTRSRRGGKLVIYFFSDEELDRIYGTIVGDE